MPTELEVDDAPKVMSAEEIAALQHIFIGPTWKRRKNGNFRLPRKTLGWEIAKWTAEFLASPDGTPWKFTYEQLRFILWWYAVDEAGRFTYRTGCLQRMKGWGKDPLLAVMCLVELVGPSRMMRDDAGLPVWDEDGQPVGTRCLNAWVQVTAVNQSQTTNTMALIPSLMTDHFCATYGINPGAELIRAMGDTCRLEAVTSSYRAIEGKRTTFTLLNETHHWVLGNQGHKMYETIDGNATKMNSRYLAITNAYLPGEDSVAERMRETYNDVVEGRAANFGLLYDSIEAHPKTPLTPEALALVIPIIRGDAVWLVIDAITQSVLNGQIPPSRSRRMYLNQIVAEEDAIYGPADWDVLEAVGALLSPDDEITLGFDGGKTDDATALVAIRVSDNVAFTLGVWEKPPNWPSGKDAPKWQVNRELVDGTVHDTFRVYKVRAFFADVALWESYIAEWETEYAEKLAIKASERSPIGWDMRQSQRKITMAHERLMQTIFDGKLLHDGDKALRRHVLNARRRSNSYGVGFGKESRESPRKVDLYAALLLAFEALHDFRLRGKVEKQRTGRGYFY